MNSDNLITLSGLLDSISGAYVNTATVTGQLLDSQGEEVDTFTLSYVASSDGVYRGNLPNETTADLTEGATYTVRVVAVAVGGNQQTFEELHTADYLVA